jgi:NADH-quinone oxidoreductase subunit B
MPEGHQGEGFFATKLNDVVGLARKNSIWPLPFATSCCGIEFMATMGHITTWQDSEVKE